MYSVFSLGTTANTRSRATISVGGVKKEIYIKSRYAEALNKWFLTIEDANQKPIISNIPALAGIDGESGDLLAQFKHLGLGSLFVVAKSEEKATVDPKLDDFKIDYVVVIGDASDE